MIYAVYGALGIVAFLVVLNGFLRGSQKTQIDAVLSLLLVGLVITAFLVAGWKLGFLAIAIVFFSGIVTRPIAARLASRLFAVLEGGDSGYVGRLFAVSVGGGSGYVGLPPRPLQKISQQLDQPFDSKKLIKELLSGGDRRATAEDALLDYCEQQPAIQALLKESQISRHDLQELFHQLILNGAGQWACGHWVAASTLAYPESLRYAIKRRGENMRQTASKLIMYFEQGSPLET